MHSPAELPVQSCWQRLSQSTDAPLLQELATKELSGSKSQTRNDRKLRPGLLTSLQAQIAIWRKKTKSLQYKLKRNMIWCWSSYLTGFYICKQCKYEKHIWTHASTSCHITSDTHGWKKCWCASAQVYIILECNLPNNPSALHSMARGVCTSRQAYQTMPRANTCCKESV